WETVRALLGVPAVLGRERGQARSALLAQQILARGLAYYHRLCADIEESDQHSIRRRSSQSRVLAVPCAVGVLLQRDCENLLQEYPARMLPQPAVIARVGREPVPPVAENARAAFPSLHAARYRSHTAVRWQAYQDAASL